MVNISQPKKITMNKFATEIIKLTATSIKVIHLHLPKDNSKQKNPISQKSKLYQVENLK
jgi:hypothetical protein